VGERRGCGRRWGRGGGGGGLGFGGRGPYIRERGKGRWWADFGSWVDYGLAVPRVKIRLSAKTHSVPRVKLLAEVILLKINFKNSKMM
jgi:hypothetical protein